MYFRPHGRGFLANNNMGVELTRRRREKITILPSGLHTKTVFLALKNSAEGRKFFEILFSLKRPKMRFSAEGGKFLDLTPFLRIPPLFVPDLQQGGILNIIYPDRSLGFCPVFRAVVRSK